MANAIRGQTPFKLAGDDYVLAFDVNRLCDLEDLMGAPAGELVGRVGTGDMKILRAFMWAGLAERPVEGRLNLVQAGEIVTALTPDRAGPLILRAMAAAFPKASESEADPLGEKAA